MRPAIRCLSMVLLMLGITFVLVSALAIWFRSPEEVHLIRLTEGRTLVRGGEALLTVLGYMRDEVALALALLAAGSAGVALCRPDPFAPPSA